MELATTKRIRAILRREGVTDSGNLRIVKNLIQKRADEIRDLAEHLRRLGAGRGAQATRLSAKRRS
jgi:hypothetical protein